MSLCTMLFTFFILLIVHTDADDHASNNFLIETEDGKFYLAEMGSTEDGTKDLMGPSNHSVMR